MGALTTIIASKAGNWTSLLLYTFTLSNGTIFRASDSPLNSSEGGFQYAGHDYFARVVSQSLGPIQSQSSLGFDVIPNISVTLADADSNIWTNYESAIGFSGARVDVDFVLASFGRTGYTFSSDSDRRFSGICDGPTIDENAGTITITAVNRLNMTRKSLPDVPCQPRCPWIFPATAIQRQAAADDSTSNYYQCGYSPDATGGNARGNYQSGTTPFTTCNLTKADCGARGMYKTDSLGRQTGDFGGSQFVPASIYWKGKSYTEGKTIDGYDFLNQARYGSAYAFVYGTNNVPDCTVMPSLGDPNSTRFEVVVGFGQMAIQRVVVNGVVASQNNPSDFLFTWRYVNDGSRHGSPCNDALYNGNGDPYGSLCCIEIVVPISLQQSGSSPQVSILANRIDTPIPNSSDPTTAPSWPRAYTTNPAYILLDLLIQTNYSYADVDLQTFMDAAAICGASITYTDNTGNTSATHERYRCSAYWHQPKPVPEVLLSVRRSFNALWAPNSFNGGLLQIFIEQTMADQQGSPVAGSNFSTAITSVTAAGTTANGYSAYDFDESNILPSSLRPYHNTIASTGNRLTIPFQDKDNQYVQDSYSNINAQAVAANGQQVIDANYSVDGIDNFDQASRIGNNWLLKNLFCNTRSDAKGTLFFDFTSTFRVSHLKVGDICRFSWQRLGISLQPVRVTSIQGTENWKQLKLTTRWHSDQHYVDSILQNPAPLFNNPGRSVPNRDPYPWKPDGWSGFNGDPLTHGDFSFGLVTDYSTDASGNSIPALDLQGFAPANVLSTLTGPPLLQSFQGSTASTGGTFPSGNLVGAVAAVDSAGHISALSRLFVIAIPAGTSTNTITTPSIFWQSGTVGYVLYTGTSELTLTLADFNPASTPSTITVAAPPLLNSGPPDLKFDHFRVQAKRMIHAGLWAIPLTSVSGTVLTFAGQVFTVNQYAGYVISLLAAAGNDPGNPQKMLNLTVVSNTATTVTVSSSTAGLNPGDILLMRSKADVSSTTSVIVDPLWVNSVYPGGLSDNDTGYLFVVLYGTGKGQTRTIASNTTTSFTLAQPLTVALDSTSVYVVVEPTWQYDFVTAPVSTSRFFASFFLPTIAVMPLSNLANQTYLIRVLAEDSAGNSGADIYAPFRETYIFGQVGSGYTSPY